MRVGIVDYGMGNLHSVRAAVHHVGGEPVFCGTPDDLTGCRAAILPGVGSFRYAMQRLTEGGWQQAIRDFVIDDGRPLLGICLGMQVLGVRSDEDGTTAGLGLIDADVVRLDPEGDSAIKIPHIGFNTIRTIERGILKGLPAEFDVYFNHGYCMREARDADTTSTAVHGASFVSSFEKDRVYGCQFHPEKSQAFGLRIIRNFLDILA